MEQARQVALLEDPHHDPEGGAQREHVEHQRLHRHQHAAEHEEQHHERDRGDDAHRQGHPAEQRRLRVDESGRLTAHLDGEGALEVAHFVDQVLALGRVGLDAGHDRPPGAARGEEAGRGRVGPDDPGAAEEGAGEGVDAGNARKARQRRRVGVDLGVVGARVARLRGHHLDGGRLLGAEVGADLVLHLAAAGRLRQHPVVGQPEADVEEGAAQDEEDEDH